MGGDGFDFGDADVIDGRVQVELPKAEKIPLWQQVIDGKQWSSADPDAWNSVKYPLQDRFEFENTSVFQSRVNAAAQEWAKTYRRLPSEMDLLNSPTLATYLSVLKQGWPTNVPPRFVLGGVYYENDPLKGPTAIEFPDATDFFSGKKVNDLFKKAAKITQEQLFQMLQPARAVSGSGRGRGGGRAARVFDRAQLIESATDRWKGLLMEDPDDAKIGGIVDRYSSKSNAFWMSKGGNLDFDTFLLNEIRGQSRYRTLYSKMAPHLTEEEWMGRYRQAAGQFGTNDTATKREVEAGASSGAGLAGFTERVGRTREVRVGDLGGFSRQLASSMQQMGRMG